MKRSQIKLVIFSAIISNFLIINLFAGFFSSNLSHFIIALFFGVISYFLFGLEKNKVFNKNKLIKYFILFVISSMIFIYAIGLLSGFLRSPYNRTIFGIIKNISWLILFYIVLELLRYNLMKKGDGSKIIFILVVLFTTLFDISLGMIVYNFKVKVELLKFTTILLIPSISKNMVLTSFSYKYGYETTIIYQLVTNLYFYIMPIYPAFDYFLTSIIGFIQPILVWALCKNVFDKEKKEDIREKHIVAKVIAGISIFLSIIIIALFSNLFRYWIAVVGTGSMSPTINVGDIIIVDKNVSKEPTKLKVGQVLVFEEKNRIYTHRITKIDDNNGNVKITTKGDRKGNAVDSWVVTNNEIIGVVKFKIPYIGYPTVWLNRMIREK